MAPWPPLRERLATEMECLFLMYYSAQYLIKNLYKFFLIEHHFPSISNLRKVKEDSFSQFWDWLTAPVAYPPPPRGSATLVPGILSQARGVVLDIGPGSGSQVTFFSANAAAITAIYGAEPNAGLHSALRQRVAEAGLDDKYHILSCPADKRSLLLELSKTNKIDTSSPSPEPIFDTIVSTRVLCSVPNLSTTTRELYSLLRPGGQVLLVEHVRNPWRKNGSLVGRAFQVLWHALGWPFFLGGCEMNRDPVAAFKNAGDWEEIDVKVAFEWQALTWVSGRLVKARG